MVLDIREARTDRLPLRRVETTMASRYVGPMPHAANQISAALRTFLPDIEGAKLHRAFRLLGELVGARLRTKTKTGQ